MYVVGDKRVNGQKGKTCLINIKCSLGCVLDPRIEIKVGNLSE